MEFPKRKCKCSGSFWLCPTRQVHFTLDNDFLCYNQFPVLKSTDFKYINEQNIHTWINAQLLHVLQGDIKKYCGIYNVVMGQVQNGQLYIDIGAAP